MSGLFHNRPRRRGDRTKVSRGSEPSANRERSDWRAYDPEAFERGAVPLTGAAADDLVALADPPPGARLLDVGTGTGIAAAAAKERLGNAGTVVAADLAPNMLAVGATKRPGISFVAADAVDLPFPNATFDVVTANFLIALVTRYDTVLFDMIRVLKQGGRLALTWWGAGQDEFQKTWRALCEEAVGQEMLDDAVSDLIPWDTRFSGRGSFEETLRDAGLHPVRIETREYRVQMSREDYLLHRSTSAIGRFVRGMLSDEGWSSFTDRVRAKFAELFPEQINEFRDVLIAVGTKASDGLQQQDVQGARRR